MYFIANIIYASYDRYAPGVECDKVYERFGDNLPNMAYVEIQYARLSGFKDVGSWYLFMNQRLSRSGAVHCLCSKAENVGKTFRIQLPHG